MTNKIAPIQLTVLRETIDLNKNEAATKKVAV